MIKDDMIIVAETEESRKPDHIGGFFASVVLALLVSTSGSWAIFKLAGLFGLSVPGHWGFNLSAGLFVGVLMADPITTFLDRLSIRRALFRGVCGIAFGVSLQHFVLTPIAGGGISNMLFLAMSLILLPMMIALNGLERILDRRGIDVSEEMSRGFVAVLRLPRAVPIALTLLIVFQILWWVQPGPVETLILLGVAALLAFIPSLTVAIMDPDHVKEDDTAEKSQGPAFTRYSSLALHELYVFMKWHLGPVLFLTTVGWFVQGILPFVPQWQRLLSFLTSISPAPFLADAALALLMLGLSFLVLKFSGKFLLKLLSKLLRWPEEDAALRYGIFKNTLLLKS